MRKFADGSRNFQMREQLFIKAPTTATYLHSSIYSGAAGRLYWRNMITLYTLCNLRKVILSSTEVHTQRIRGEKN